MSARLQFFCDIHSLKGEDAPIGGDSLFGFDGEWYKFGICVLCDKEFVADFRALVLEHGIKLKKGELAGFLESVGRSAGKLSGDAICLWCEWGGTNGALHQHLKMKHGFNGTKDAYGETCPLCNMTSKNLGVHGNARHGANGISQVFVMAEEAGDPFKIVAERRKLKPTKKAKAA